MSNTTNSGSGFLSLLLVAFIVLKLTNYIDWSWWWVLSPIWISFLLAPVITLPLVIIGAAVMSTGNARRRRLR